MLKNRVFYHSHYSFHGIHKWGSRLLPVQYNKISYLVSPHINIMFIVEMFFFVFCFILFIHSSSNVLDVLCHNRKKHHVFFFSKVYSFKRSDVKFDSYLFSFVLISRIWSVFARWRARMQRQECKMIWNKAFSGNYAQYSICSFKWFTRTARKKIHRNITHHHSIKRCSHHKMLSWFGGVEHFDFNQNITIIINRDLTNTWIQILYRNGLCKMHHC